MSSIKQITANRANAKRSSGPKTAAGKARSARNAQRHGLLTVGVLPLAWESATELGQLRLALQQEYAPQTVMECAFVNQIVDHLWRLRRLSYLESGMELAHSIDRARTRAEKEGYGDRPIKFSRRLDLEPPQVIYPEGDGYCEDADETTAGDEEEEPYHYTYNVPDLGQAFLEDAAWCDGYTKFQRYRTGIENSLHRAMHELDRLQASRREGSGTGTGAFRKPGCGPAKEAA